MPDCPRSLRTTTGCLAQPTSFIERPIYLLAPYGYKRRVPPLNFTVVTHYSRALTDSTSTRGGTRGALGSRVLS